MLNISLDGLDVWSVIGALADDLRDTPCMSVVNNITNKVTEMEQDLQGISTNARQIIQNNSSKQTNYILTGIESKYINVRINIKNKCFIVTDKQFHIYCCVMSAEYR